MSDHNDTPDPDESLEREPMDAEDVAGYLHSADLVKPTETETANLPAAFPLTTEEEPSEGPTSRRKARDAQLIASREGGATRITREQRNRTTRRSLLAGVGVLAAAGFGWNRLLNQQEAGNIPGFLRGGFEWNDAVWSTLFDEGGLAPEFSVAQATELRTNGSIGLDPELDPTTWSLSIVGVDGTEIDQLSIDDVGFDTVAGIPTFDQVTQHKCIEGWANITHWTGVRFSDLITRYETEAARAEYVSLQTPDGEYMVGLDMTSAMHPQTLLASGLEGTALPPEHGAPLRLVTPLHYGIKSLKRIGQIAFTTERPEDYWAERGYDWHSTH